MPEDPYSGVESCLILSYASFIESRMYVSIVIRDSIYSKTRTRQYDRSAHTYAVETMLDLGAAVFNSQT